MGSPPSLLSLLTSLWNTLRRGSLHNLPTNCCVGSVTLMTLLSSGCAEWKIWRGFLTIWMAFTGIYISPWAYREATTYPFLTLKYTVDHKVYQEPTHTNLYLDHGSHHRPSNVQAVLSSLVHGARALCDKRIHAELELLKNTFRENGCGMKQMWWALSPLVRTSKLKRLFFFYMSRWHMASSAECWPNTTSDILVCHLERSPVSFVQWRMTWDWGLWGYTAFPVSVGRCTLDRLVDV